MNDTKKVDLRITVKAQCGPIMRAIEKLGSRQKLADAVGVSMATIGLWANFKTQPGAKQLPNARMQKAIKKLCKICEAHVKDIFPDLTADELKLLQGVRKYDKQVSVESLGHQSKTLNMTYERPLTEETIELAADMDELLNELPPQAREIIKMRYGIGCKPHTLDEVGKIFDVTATRIRDLEARAIRRLQQPGLSQKIVGHVD